MAEISGPPKKEVVAYGGSISSRDLSSRPPPTASDLRCYSASYTHFQHPPPPPLELQQPKIGPSKDSSSSFRRGWSLGDPDVQRKRRVATYKSYSMQGKFRNSIKKSFRWVKDKYTNIVYGIS